MSSALKETLIHGMFKSLYHEGYHACNLIELLQRCGTSKGGLYHHFGSKKELALVSLRSIMEPFLKTYWEKGLESSDPIGAFESLLKNLPHARLTSELSFELRYGSIMNNMVHEMSALDDDFALLLKELYEHWTVIFEKAFEKSLQHNILRKGSEPRQLAEFAVATIEGAITLAKSAGDESAYHAVTASFITYLNTHRPNSLKPAAKRDKPVSHSLFE